MRREPVIERQVNPLGSVVTLTAQLNFPADLLTDEGKVTVIGTETKKITLESRFNKPLVKSLLSDCSLNQNILDPCLKSQKAKLSDLSTSCISLVKSSCKSKEANCDHDVKGDAKVLTEVNENISNPQKKVEERENVFEPLEKKGKNGKNKRKISKGEKSKLKVDVESKIVDETFTLTQDDSALIDMSVSPVEIDRPVCEGMLHGTEDIEMQLREASLEKDVEENITKAEDCKGYKRNLYTSVEIKASTDELILHEVDTNKNEELKENDNVSSRLRKKSRTNDQDVLSAYSSSFTDNKKNSEQLEEKVNDSIDKLNKLEEKGKGKKKKSKRSNNLFDPVCGEVNSGTSSNPVDKLEIPSYDVKTPIVSQETPCLQVCEDSVEINFQNNEKDFRQEISESFTTMDEFSRTAVERELTNINDEIQFIEEKSSTTDDELNGFESDLLVKENSWSPEKSPEKDASGLIDDKDSDKDNDKVKNEETTDKDSSDDCQPVLVKFDSKHAQKRGKNRKFMRKNREADSKLTEVEIKPDENFYEGDAVKLEIDINKEVKERKLSSPKVDMNKEVLKFDSEEDIFMDAKKNQKEIKFRDEAFADLNVSFDGIKRRIRKKETQENEKSEDFDMSGFDVPKRSWSSVVALSSEDPNGNVSKPEELVPSVKSWSSVASAPAKLKGQDIESAKTNSVEDRDSVYESCNDSVGEELEPALDSLGSCYYEPEIKDETEDTEIVLNCKKEEAQSESKNGSSVEEKSNTDSGEKEELVLGVQTSTKKSKKQKKKKR